MKKAVITVTVIGSVVADREVYLFGPRSVWIAEHVKDGIAQVHRAHQSSGLKAPFTTGTPTPLKPEEEGSVHDKGRRE
jgi:hypothetical protein